MQHTSISQILETGVKPMITIGLIMNVLIVAKDGTLTRIGIENE
jgi:hypothetical protein